MAKQQCDVALIFPPVRVWDHPRNFPTGLGLLAARLRQAGYTVAVIDANGQRLSDEAVARRVRRLRPAVVGIGGLITTYGWVKRLTRQLKQYRPELPIMLGGSVGSSIVETALKRLAVDVVALGEADDTVLELAAALLEGRSLEQVAGLAYLRDGQVVQTAPRPLIEDISTLAFPAWDLFPMEVYLANPVVGVGRDIDIISSRGCPFGCKYCYKVFGRQFRGRSAEHVVGEMEALKTNYDVDFISFQDDCFVIDKERVYAICDLIDKSSVLQDIRWSCNGRVSVCDLELVRRMRASGCISVAYGIESGSQHILRAMNKQANLEQMKEVIRIGRQAGVRTPLAFMIGYPGETRETVMETVAFCQDMNIPLKGMTFVCPYPGTPLYAELRGQGKLQGDEEDLVLQMGDAVDFTVNLTEMNDGELMALRAEAIAMAQASYQPPSPEQTVQQERALYGEALYRKAQEQMRDPRMQAHRKRHGFNEGQEELPEGATDIGDGGSKSDEQCFPGWVTGRGEPYVIAEAGVNHNGRLALALELVDAAAQAGADAVKFQAFRAEELVTPDAAKAAYQQDCGPDDETQYDMLKRLELTVNDFRVLQQRCRECGLDFLVTPFSPGWVDSLMELGVSALKLGSGSLGALALLRAVGGTRRPVLLSTGMADLAEVDEALSVLRQAGADRLAVMHCVSLYPAKLEQVNLRAMQTLASHTGLRVGFSDHTREVVTGALAVAAGASILEKHLTLDRTMEGPDHRASLEPTAMRRYVRLACQAHSAMGQSHKQPLPEERAIREVAWVSLAAKQPIPTNALIAAGMLTEKRPGTGIAPRELDKVAGQRAARNIAAGELLTWDMLRPQEQTSQTPLSGVP